MVGRTIRRLLAAPTDARVAICMILFVAGVRLVQEAALFGYEVRAGELLGFMPDFVGFYTVMFLSVWAALRFGLPGEGDRVTNLAAVGLLLGLLPPLLESLVRNVPEAPYDYFWAWEWLFHSPERQPVSETITLWFAVLGPGLVSLWHTRRPGRAAATSAFTWCLLVLPIVVFPGLLAEHVDNDTVRFANTLASYAWCILLYVALRGRRLWPSFARVNHALPFGALALIAASWVGQSLFDMAWRALLMTWTWTVLIIHNDHYDAEEDRTQGRPEGATGDDVAWTMLLLLNLLLMVFHRAPLVGLAAAMMLLAGFLYQHPAMRLKRHFCLSYKVEGVWATCAVAAGLALNESFAPDRPLFFACLLAFGGGALLSMPKDWKDIDADRAAGIPTLYVRLSRDDEGALRLHRRLSIAVAAAMALSLGIALAIGAHPVGLALATAAAAGAVAALLVEKRPRVAVESYFWLLSAFLLALAVAIGHS